MRVFKIEERELLPRVMAAVNKVIVGMLPGGPVEVELKRLSKSRDQEKKYHAMIQDIAATVELDGRMYDLEVWKAWLVDDFEQEMIASGTPLKHPGKIVLSLDGRRAITVRSSTAKFRVGEARDFIEYLYMKGTEFGARFSDPTLEAIAADLESRGAA